MLPVPLFIFFSVEFFFHRMPVMTKAKIENNAVWALLIEINSFFGSFSFGKVRTELHEKENIFQLTYQPSEEMNELKAQNCTETFISSHFNLSNMTLQ